MKFSIYQLSRIGGRAKNEDRMGYSYTRSACLLVLADGMGGHPEGEVAAQMALHSMTRLFQSQARPSLADPSGFLAAGVMAAHHEIVRYASKRALTDTPRTTVVAALIQDGVLFWVHCGDSRLYIARDGELLTRTRDHSYSESKVPRDHPGHDFNRSVLFTCLGSVTRPLFDLGGPLPLRAGDRLLLCSDGLWDSVEESFLVRTLSSLPVNEAVPALVEQALTEAGEQSDNVTVVALDWASKAASAPDSGFTETGELDDGGFASTIQGLPDLDGEPDAFDDDEIERSIAEINAAIQRTLGKR